MTRRPSAYLTLFLALTIVTACDNSRKKPKHGQHTFSHQNTKPGAQTAPSDKQVADNKADGGSQEQAQEESSESTQEQKDLAEQLHQRLSKTKWQIAELTVTKSNGDTDVFSADKLKAEATKSADGKSQNKVTNTSVIAEGAPLNLRKFEFIAFTTRKSDAASSQNETDLTFKYDFQGSELFLNSGDDQSYLYAGQVTLSEDGQTLEISREVFGSDASKVEVERFRYTRL